MYHSLKFLILSLAILVVACESSEEKAERLRLETLYALDNTKVAKAYLKAEFGGAAYAKEYLDIMRECAKEELKAKGKWCEKHDQIKKIFLQLHADSWGKSMQVPKF